jgi:hypothetical protein
VNILPTLLLTHATINVLLSNLLIRCSVSNGLGVLFNVYEVFQLLTEIKKKTAAGVDGPPFWLFRDCARISAPVADSSF